MSDVNMTWGELKEYAKSTGIYICTYWDEFNVDKYFYCIIKSSHWCFFVNGLVECGVDLSEMPRFRSDGMVRFDTVIENRTPYQMYQIIKNLTEKGVSNEHYY